MNNILCKYNGWENADNNHKCYFEDMCWPLDDIKGEMLHNKQINLNPHIGSMPPL